MARDLVAVLVLIGISCSGFFVAFTLAFGNETDKPNDVAYTLFQLIMGFTPAAWDKWTGYNRLGQGALVLFMFITHFLVVTILITVLTNSFMAIVQNANDEHQFVFAINTISMVKSDALFSYVAPANILAWTLTPLRSCLPFRQYILLNRTIIKITHFPILFGICAYERLLLMRSVYEPTDLIERRGRIRDDERDGLFTSRTVRTRERSAATMFQDKALEAVFQRPLRRSTSRATRGTAGGSARPDRVDTWISQMDEDGPTGPPMEQDRGVVDKLERRRGGRIQYIRRTSGTRNATTTMSVASDPENFLNSARIPRSAFTPFGDGEWQDVAQDGLAGQGGNDGDDEFQRSEAGNPDLPTPDSEHTAFDYLRMATRPAKSDKLMSTKARQASAARSPQSIKFRSTSEVLQDVPEIALQTPLSDSTRLPEDASARSPVGRASAPLPQRELHNRTLSSNTILYKPIGRSEAQSTSTSTAVSMKAKEKQPNVRATTPPDGNQGSEPSSNKKLSKHRRPQPNDRSNFMSTPNLNDLLARTPPRDIRSKRNSYNFDIVSDLGDNKAPAGGYLAAMPASFGTHIEYTNRSGNDENEDQRRMSRLMLARMNTLEQGFKEVIKEVKDWRRGDTGALESRQGSLLSVPSATKRSGRDSNIKSQKALGKKRKEGDWTEEALITPTTTERPETPSFPTTSPPPAERRQDPEILQSGGNAQQQGDSSK